MSKERKQSTKAACAKFVAARAASSLPKRRSALSLRGFTVSRASPSCVAEKEPRTRLLLALRIGLDFSKYLPGSSAFISVRSRSLRIFARRLRKALTRQPRSHPLLDEIACPACPGRLRPWWRNISRTPSSATAIEYDRSILAAELWASVVQSASFS